MSGILTEDFCDFHHSVIAKADVESPLSLDLLSGFTGTFL
jgi:hypothetical protein